eukprot:Clim_evm7s150 gene=Clim_evmTU7s150
MGAIFLIKLDSNAMQKLLCGAEALTLTEQLERIYENNGNSLPLRCRTIPTDTEFRELVPEAPEVREENDA